MYIVIIILYGLNNMELKIEAFNLCNSRKVKPLKRTKIKYFIYFPRENKKCLEATLLITQ